MGSAKESFGIFKILQDQVNDLKFVDDDEKLKGYLCFVCSYVAISHCIVDCDAVLCSKCYLRFYQKPCPSCNVTLTSNKLDDEFEADVLQLKVECKFSKHGCTEIVSLINFRKHVKSCKFAFETTLPELCAGKNQVAEDLKQLTNDFNRIEEEIKTMQIKSEQRIKEIATNVSHEEFKKDKEVYDDKLQKVTKSTEAMHTEITQIKEMVQKCQEAAKVLQDQNKNNFQKTKVDFITELKILNAIGFQKLTDDEHYKKIALDAEIKQIKENQRKTEDAIKEEMDELRASSLQKISDNKTATDRIDAEVTVLKRIIQDESIRQMENIKKEYKNEIHKLETTIQESKTLMDKTKTEHQSEIQTLKSEHKAELRAMEFQQEGRLEILENQLTELQYRHKDDGGDVLPDISIWKITGITEIMKDLVEKKLTAYRSENYFTNQNGGKFKPGIYTAENGKHVYIDLEFMDLNSSEPYLHSRRFILIDQSTSIRKNNVEMIDRPQCQKNSAKYMMGKCLYFTGFFPVRLLQGQNNYVKNDAIVIKIILEPIAFLWKQIDAQNGVFVWRINDYSKKKRDEINGVKRWLTSKPFKTSHVGYTANVALYLNGKDDSEGKYITIYFRFLLGEHDDSLQLPFICKRTHCLLDQSDSPTKENISKEYTSEFRAGNLNVGVFQFVPQSTVESSKYLKNDSIIIQTTVQIL